MRANLETMKKRLKAALEEKVAKEGIVLTKSQFHKLLLIKALNQF